MQLYPVHNIEKGEIFFNKKDEISAKICHLYVNAFFFYPKLVDILLLYFTENLWHVSFKTWFIAYEIFTKIFVEGLMYLHSHENRLIALKINFK